MAVTFVQSDDSALFNLGGIFAFSSGLAGDVLVMHVAVRGGTLSVATVDSVPMTQFATLSYSEAGTDYNHYVMTYVLPSSGEFNYQVTPSSGARLGFTWVLLDGADLATPVVQLTALTRATSTNSQALPSVSSSFDDSYRVVFGFGYLASWPNPRALSLSGVPTLENTSNDDTTHSMLVAGGTVDAGDLAAVTLSADQTVASLVFVDLLVSSGEEPPPPPPETVTANAGDRLRSSVSETTGSLLDAVDVRAVDASVSEAYTYAQELAGTSLRTFREVLRTRDSATADFAYFPQPRQNIVMENQYTGISVLSRLARYYPPRIFDDVVNLGIAAIPAATATDIIDYVLTQWAAANDWLTFEPVPDLRVPMPGLVPSDYGVGTGQVYAATVTIRQDGTNRQDALSILRDLLSPFPGTVVRQNSTGKLEIVPASGPDADETPHVTLTTDDLYSVTIGKPNPFDVINRCTVTASGGLTQDEDVAVMQPAWFQVGSAYQFGRSNWYSPPVDRVNLQPFDDPTDDTLQEGLTISSNFNLQKPVLWPISGDAIPAGDGISLVDTLAAEQVTIAWARYFNDSLVSSGANGLTITTSVIPFSGAWVDALSVSFSTGGETVFANIRMRWNETEQGIEIGLGTAKLETDCFTGCNGVIIEFTLNDASVGYTEGTSVSGTFGFVGDDDTVLPADSVSGDAVLDSQSALGIVERTINIKGYAFDAVTLSQIARGYVIQNITPKVTRELDVAALSGYRVLFDDIGRLIQLPSGDVGFLTGVSYTDDFVSRTVRKTATVEVRDIAAAGAIDTATLYHILEDGTYWTTEVTGLPIAREEQP